jgi:hypothetical protein
LVETQISQKLIVLGILSCVRYLDRRDDAGPPPPPIKPPEAARSPGLGGQTARQIPSTELVITQCAASKFSIAWQRGEMSGFDGLDGGGSFVPDSPKVHL